MGKGFFNSNVQHSYLPRIQIAEGLPHEKVEEKTFMFCRAIMHLACWLSAASCLRRELDGKHRYTDKTATAAHRARRRLFCRKRCCPNKGRLADLLSSTTVVRTLAPCCVSRLVFSAPPYLGKVSTPAHRKLRCTIHVYE